MLEVWNLMHDPRVHTVVGPMCRWEKARGPGGKEGLVRKDPRWLTSSKDMADVLCADGCWKHEHHHVPLIGRRGTDAAASVPHRNADGNTSRKVECCKQRNDVSDDHDDNRVC